MWTAGVSHDGYGRFRLGKKNIYAHVLSYQIAVGKIPEGMEIDHKCRVTRCVNPDHLEPVTHKKNMLRGKNPVATHARKTHCVNGHPFDAANTYFQSGRRRQCRACNAEAVRRYKAKGVLA